MSEKSQATRTSKNVFEKSNSKTQYFVSEVKARRMTKNRVEFLIGWCDFPLDKDDVVEAARERVPSDVVEAARPRVPSFCPDGQTAPGCSCHFCVS